MTFGWSSVDQMSPGWNARSIIGFAGSPRGPITRTDRNVASAGVARLDLARATLAVNTSQATLFHDRQLRVFAHKAAQPDVDILRGNRIQLVDFKLQSAHGIRRRCNQFSWLEQLLSSRSNLILLLDGDLVNVITVLFSVRLS